MYSPQFKEINSNPQLAKRPPLRLTQPTLCQLKRLKRAERLC